MTKHHTFNVSVNDRPTETITVATGIYEFAAAAVPALLGYDELPIEVTIWTEFSEFRYRLHFNEFGHMAVDHLVRTST